jgi:hypothetical protein
MNKISYLSDTKIAEINKFKKEYPKIYAFLSAYVEGRRNVIMEFKKFLVNKDTLTHNELLELGYVYEKTYIGTTFDSYLAPKSGLGKTLFYADIFQYLHDEKVKDNNTYVSQ